MPFVAEVNPLYTRAGAEFYSLVLVTWQPNMTASELRFKFWKDSFTHDRFLLHGFGETSDDAVDNLHKKHPPKTMTPDHVRHLLIERTKIRRQISESISCRPEIGNIIHTHRLGETTFEYSCEEDVLRAFRGIEHNCMKFGSDDCGQIEVERSVFGSKLR